MVPLSTDVLIAGAGPTGLALAAALQQAGVDHVIVDPQVERHHLSRAGVVHAHTLEMLGAIHVADRLIERGMPVRTFAVREQERALLSVDFAGLPTAYDQVLMLPQYDTEAVLEARLVELGGGVRRGFSVTAAEQTAHGASVRIEGNGVAHTIAARFVVAGDGMHSVVRDAAGIAFPGAAYGESFVLTDVRLDPPLPRTEVSLLFARDGLVVVAPLPDGSFRIVATVDDAPEQPTVADIQALLDARIRSGAVLVVDLAWSSRFRVHHRLADSYRQGPFLLMGDAAHVHSPAGGQGMNTGLVDAIVLGEALVRVLNGEPDTLLDTYGLLRRDAARQVLALADRLTRVATASGPLRLIRNLLLRFLDHMPAFKARLALSLSGLSRKGLATLPVATSASAEPPMRPGTGPRSAPRKLISA